MAPNEQAMTLEHLDPASLIADGNIRKDLRLTKEFITSIAERGVLVPLVCLRTSDGVKIRYGHRRAFGAIEAGQPTVPCIVTDAPDGGIAADVERILTQYDENTHREGLTTAESAGVVAELLDLGMTTEFIARQTQMRRGDVHAAQKLTRSKAATAAAGKYTFLSLDQAAGLAEFEDDPAALRELTAAAEQSESHFRHTLQYLRDNREQHQVLAAARKEAEAAGITVLDKRPGWNSSIDQLVDGKGKRITEKNHRNCPGHAVFLRTTWRRPHSEPAGEQDPGSEDTGIEDLEDEDFGGRDSVMVAEHEVYCTDPRANGHKPRYGSGTGTATAAKPTREERREVIDNNKLWRSAETVRRTWIREYLTRKTIPARALRFVLEALAHGDPQLTAVMSSYSGSHALARDLLGIAKSDRTGGLHTNEVLAAITTATDGRAQVIALAIVIGAYESATDVMTWRNPNTRPWAQRYFALLKDLGYGLSDVEELVLAGKEAR
jgi:ParB family transcriptional regulator, chromosome partitioning protein